MKLKISGILYDVVYRSTEEMNGLIGSADFNKQLISINKDHTAQTQEIAFVHEVLHILSDAYGVGMSEEQIKIMTHAIVALYKDNELHENLDIRS
jgi:hypothetical protein